MATGCYPDNTGWQQGHGVANVWENLRNKNKPVKSLELQVTGTNIHADFEIDNIELKYYTSERSWRPLIDLRTTEFRTSQVRVYKIRYPILEYNRRL